LTHLLLIYDIVHDGIRTKIGTACEDYGLDRIQYSAFYGQLARTHQEELMMKIEKLLGKEAGRVQLIPIANNEWARRLQIAQGEMGRAHNEQDTDAQGADTQDADPQEVEEETNDAR
jgi:CRISPR-associated protein Cas2